MKQDNIFTILESKPLWVRAVEELKAASVEFRHDPKKFILNVFRGDPLQAKRKRYLRVGISMATFFWIFGSIVYLGWYYYRPVPQKVEAEDLQKIVDLTTLQAPEIRAPKAPQRASGGGGGGKREMTPPSRGRLPKADLRPPIVAPTAHPPKIEKPSLPVAPTIQVQPELIPQQAMNIPIGDPKGIPGPPSDGPGEGQGIGTGKGGGVGSGRGTGLGPGEGFNTGGGSPGLGGGDGIYAAGKDGVKGPQILSKQKPKYTEDARRDKIQGVVVLSAVFRKDGSITDIKVVRGLGYGLDEEAIKAAALIKFIPGQRDGQAVNVRARLEFTFSLL